MHLPGPHHADPTPGLAIAPVARAGNLVSDGDHGFASGAPAHRVLDRKGLALDSMPMEPLSNPQHDAFARALAEGRSPAQAAIDAGYAPASAATTARRLAARPEVAARIAALRAAAPAATPPPDPAAPAPGPLPTRETVLRGLADALTEARGQGNIMAQLRALELMGKELGMFGQRQEARPDNPLACLDAQSLLLLRDLLAEDAGVAA